MKISELTKAEEEIMQVLWKLEKGFVKEIRAEMPEPKPAYNTVSTIVRILQKKGMVAHDILGKSHCYFPLISKEEYSKHKMENLMKGYFEGSFSRMVSFFVENKKLNTREIEDILQILQKESKQ